MSLSPGQDTATLEQALLRLGTLTESLDKATAGGAKEVARELLELVLDLHGLALARMISAVAKAENGSELTEQLIADPYIRAALLLHGLHPHDAELRLRQTIERLRPQWDARGFRVDLLGTSSGSARIRLYKNGSGEPADELRREVEEILVDAAPDLDEIVIEIDTAGSVKSAASAM
jgi:hypothetical protein